MELSVRVKEKEFMEEELKLRAIRYDPYRDLLMDYFERAKAPKTVEMYKGAFARVKKWECRCYQWRWTI